MRRPRFGDELPKTLEAHSGAVIFGGPQSANDDDEIVKREIDWIGVPLKEKKPFLGICLGAQMLAKQLGARVYKHADGHAEVGYYPIRPTAEAAPSARTGRSTSINGIARASTCRKGLDAGRGRFVSGAGIQLRRHRLCAAIPHGRDSRHDVPMDMRGHERMTLPTPSRAKPIRGRLMHDPACRAWLSEFIDHWLKAPEPARGRKGEGYDAQDCPAQDFAAEARARQRWRRSAPGGIEGFDPAEGWGLIASIRLASWCR